MGEVRKNRLHKVVTTLLSVMLVLVMALPVQAATNKALGVKCTFNGQSFEKNGDKCAWNNNYAIVLTKTQTAAAILNLKLSATAYIPKEVLKKDGASVAVNLYVDVDQKGEYYATALGRYAATAVRERNKIQLYGWDEQLQKNVKLTNITLKTGKGAYKNYYIITFNKIPIAKKMYVQDKKVTLKKTDSYKYRMGLGVCAENYKGTSQLYFDNMTVTSGAKTLMKADFSKKTSIVVINKDKEISSKKFAIKKF